MKRVGRLLFVFLWSIVWITVSVSLQPMNKKVAIIGGGFAGLSSAYQFAQHGAKAIHLFDAFPAGEAPASSAAGGLMHPLSPKGTFLWNGLKSYLSSKKLFEDVERITGMPFIARKTPLIRPITKESDDILWKKSYESMKDWIQRLSESEMREIYGDSMSGIITAYKFKEAIIIDSPRYLQSLWKVVQLTNQNSQWIHQNITDLSELVSEYDAVILCAGSQTPHLLSQLPKQTLPPLSIRYVAGSNMIFSNNGERPLSQALLSGEYIVPKIDDTGSPTIVAGATHDHLPQTGEQPILPEYSIDGLSENLLPKLLRIYPHLRKEMILGTKAGLRLVTQRTNYGRLPILGSHPNYSNLWIFSGLGARGLLYHSMLSELLIHAISTSNSDHIPSEIRLEAHFKR